MSYYGNRFHFSIDDFARDLQKMAQEAPNPAKPIAFQLGQSLLQEVSNTEANPDIDIFLRDVSNKSAFLNFLDRNQVKSTDNRPLVYKHPTAEANPVPEKDRQFYTLDQQSGFEIYIDGVAAYLANLQSQSAGDSDPLLRTSLGNLVTEFGSNAVNNAKNILNMQSGQNGAPGSGQPKQPIKQIGYDKDHNNSVIYQDADGKQWVAMADQNGIPGYFPYPYNGGAQQGASQAPNVPQTAEQKAKSQEALSNVQKSFPFMRSDSISPLNMDNFIGSFLTYANTLPVTANSAKLRNAFGNYYNDFKKSLAGWDSFIQQTAALPNSRSRSMRDQVRYTPSAGSFQLLRSAFGNTDANAREAADHLRDMVRIVQEALDAIKDFPELQGLAGGTIDQNIDQAETFFRSLNDNGNQ